MDTKKKCSNNPKEDKKRPEEQKNPQEIDNT